MHLVKSFILLCKLRIDCGGSVEFMKCWALYDQNDRDFKLVGRVSSANLHGNVGLKLNIEDLIV